jgi:hypothetical protein
MTDTKTASFMGAADPDRDTYTTPPWISRALGRVWLDPCSNERSVIQSERVFRLDRGQNGLALAKFVPRNPPGIVFLNPPYSDGQVIQWVRGYRMTRFCFLVRHDPSTEWFSELFAATGMIAQPRDRVDFQPPPGAEINGSNPYPHALFYRDACDVSQAMRDICYLMEPKRN